MAVKYIIIHFTIIYNCVAKVAHYPVDFYVGICTGKWISFLWNTVCFNKTCLRQKVLFYGQKYPYVASLSSTELPELFSNPKKNMGV